MKRLLSLILVVTLCFCMVQFLSSCKKEDASLGNETESFLNNTEAFLNNNDQAVDEQDELTSDEDSLTSTAADAENVEQEEQTDKIILKSTTAYKQSKTRQTSSSQSKSTKKSSNDPKPKSQDFKTLESILNWDGGLITEDNFKFDYKTTSQKEFIKIANSYGFVPAYRAYINKDIFNSSNLIDIDNDGYLNMRVTLKGFNWVLKNIYNYSGSEISSSNPCGCDVRGDKIYFWLPPDEGGVFGEFRFKNSSERDGKYVIRFDYYSMIDPYVDNVQYEFDSVYTVTADFKTVRNVDNTGDINVWSIYSIEKT